jgi:dTDP-4-dehydrorhamnose 3,5-epimerase
MKFNKTPLNGAYWIDLNFMLDERGFFARSWCQREFAAQGLDTRLSQCNVSYNRKKGTLRGMHYQIPPYAESKLVRCTSGSIFDVIIDVRPDSPTFLKWYGMELSRQNHRMLFIPMGFAHGFLTLEDDTEVFYQMSEFYTPESARGFRWNDELFNVSWPDSAELISEKDRNYLACRPEDFYAFRTNAAI